MKRFVSLFLLCWGALSLSQVHAQAFLQGQQTPSLDLHDVQARFDQWASQRDLRETKGWKYYQRWAWHMESRLEADGTYKGTADYDQIAARYQAITTHSARQTGWSPVGPLNYVTPATNSQVGHGIGRINHVAFHPTNPNIMFVATPNGGIWKTVNGGGSWEPASDGLPTQRIAHIAINAQNPQQMYCATGDGEIMTFPFGAVGRVDGAGLGVYKSLDGGQTWVPTGLMRNPMFGTSSIVRRVRIHPSRPDWLLAVAANGVWRSTDGGDTWSLSLSSLCYDVHLDPQTPETLYAAGAYLGFVGAGQANIWKSTDFGDNWTPLNTGFPSTGVVTRYEIVIAPSDPNRIYALAVGLDDGMHAFIRSEDAGNTWTVEANGSTLNIMGWFDGNPATDAGGQGFYDVTLAVDPDDPDKVYGGGVNLWGSENGGKSWEGVTFWLDFWGTDVHADHHFAAFHPLTKEFFICHDGGIDKTGQLVLGSWTAAFNCLDVNFNPLPGCDPFPTQWQDLSQGIGNVEFYRIGLFQGAEARVIGGTQDNGTFYNSQSGWLHIYGGDGMDCLIDPEDPELVFATNYNGALHRSQDGGQTFTNGILDQILNDTSLAEAGDWVTPIKLHPDSGNIIYAGLRNLWRSTNRGFSWEKLSSFTDTVNTLGTIRLTREFEISPTDPNVIYLIRKTESIAGMNGAVMRSDDGGQSWVDVTLGLPTFQIFYNDIAIGEDPMHAWVTLGGYLGGQRVYETFDGGQTWLSVSDGLPNLPVNTIVFQDDSFENFLYVGTDMGVYAKSEADSAWTLFSDNLPLTTVADLEIHHATRKLYAGTYGRGAWMADLKTGTPPTVGLPAIYEADIKVYPNPAQGAFWVDMQGLETNSLQVELVDMMGRLLIQENWTVMGSAHKQQVQATLAPGQYFLRVSDGTHHQTHKIRIN